MPLSIFLFEWYSNVDENNQNKTIFISHVKNKIRGLFHLKCSYWKKYTLILLIKFLENIWNYGKNLQNLRGQNHAKYWTGLTFGHFILIFMD